MIGMGTRGMIAGLMLVSCLCSLVTICRSEVSANAVVDNDTSAGNTTSLFTKECASENYCFNGGTCRIIGKLDIMICMCPKEFDGRRCQIERNCIFDVSVISVPPAWTGPVRQEPNRTQHRVTIPTQSELKMDINPPNILRNFHKTLTVNCSFYRTDILKIAALRYLEITRISEKGNKSTLAFMHAGEGPVPLIGGAVGRISVHRESYLIVTLNNATDAIPGEYTCTAVGKAFSGQNVTVNYTKPIKVSEVSGWDLLEIHEAQISAMRSLDAAADLARKQSEKADHCCSRWRSSLRAVFQKSEDRFIPGSLTRYYLSPPSRFQFIGDSEVQCQLMGGYLAQMSDENEFNFVRRFVESTSAYIGIFIAGSDEHEENNWVINPRSDTPMYLSWGSGQPNEGRSANCLCLWKGLDWKMADYTCANGRLSHAMGFLCEVPLPYY